MYRRLQPMIAALAASTRAGTRGMDYFAVGSDQIAAEVQFDYHLSTGVERRVRIAAFVPFVDDRMAGETQYVDRYLAEEIDRLRSEEHTSELQSLMRNSYAVFCLKKKTKDSHIHTTSN